jgi:hypothetical protein
MTQSYPHTSVVSNATTRTDAMFVLHAELEPVTAASSSNDTPKTTENG